MTRISWNKSRDGKPRIIVDAMVHIPKEEVALDRVKRDLRVRNEMFWAARAIGASTSKAKPYFDLWTETDDVVSVPRHYFLTTMQVEPGCWASTYRPEIVDIRSWPRFRGKVEHQITLRENGIQIPASDALQSPLMLDKMISLSCGAGKTIVALHAAAEGQRFPLLVVVNSNALMDQWRANYSEENVLIGGIQKVYGLKPKDIGHVQGKKSDWKGKAVAIAMLHTLVQKEFEPEFYEYWRTVVYDEIHRLGAGSFSKAASLFPAERWGLSATMEREDKMDKLFRMHVGNVAFESHDQPLTPDIYFMGTGITVNMDRFTMKNGRVNLAQLQTHLSEMEKRDDLMFAWIKRAADEGRKIIILGERVAQSYRLAARFNAAGMDAAVYVGSIKKKEARQEALRHQIVFATQHIAREGLDKEVLDTLFLLMPFGGFNRAKQSIGRILRATKHEKKPVVTVFVDEIGIMQAIARKLERHAKKLKFTRIHHVSSKKTWAITKRGK